MEYVNRFLSKNVVLEIINPSNSGYLYMNYYLHIFIPLMHIYIQCITYDLLVIVEYRTATYGIHVRDTKLL
jgi:hypothetical protein